MNSVSFVLDAKDFDALTRLVEKKRNGRFDWINRSGIPIIAVFLASIPYVLRWIVPGLPDTRELWWPCFGGAVAVIFIGLFNFLVKILGRQRFRKSPYFGSEAHLILSAKGVEARGVNGESLSFWSHITRVEITTSHVFLFLSEKMALIAPKRAFASTAEAENFGALAQKFWSDAHPNTAPPIAAPH